MNVAGNSVSFDVTTQFLTRQNGKKKRCDEVRAFNERNGKKSNIKIID